MLDFPCRDSGDVTLPQEAYTDPEGMLAAAMEQAGASGACLLPFCHTLEAEGLGAVIRLDGGTPRARSFAYPNMAELPRPLVFRESRRFRTTLEVCQRLRQGGHTVIFQLTGPLTILNSLVSTESLFRSLRKEPEAMLDRCREIGGILLAQIGRLEALGIDTFSYADPSGAPSIIGPKYAEKMARMFTQPFLQAVDQAARPGSLFFLCPRTAFALIGSDCAAWEDHDTESPMPYIDAALAARGRVRFVGQGCIKENREIANIKELKV